MVKRFIKLVGLLNKFVQDKLPYVGNWHVLFFVFFSSKVQTVTKNDRPKIARVRCQKHGAIQYQW